MSPLHALWTKSCALLRLIPIYGIKEIVLHHIAVVQTPGDNHIFIRGKCGDTPKISIVCAYEREKAM
jgi:hypothetical protein